ncbi:MAG: hypothetical protein ABIV42_03875 [Nitrosospira sp.]
MKPDLSIFPITGWEVETVSTDELVFVRFNFVSDIRQQLNEADVSSPYAMEIEQARELRDALTRAIDRIDHYGQDTSFRSDRGKAIKTRS